MAPFLPTTSTTPDPCMIQDLTADELRWLEASEIIDFPTSPTDSFHLNDRVVLSQRSSRFTEDFHRPTPYPNARLNTTSSASSTSERDEFSSRRSTLTNSGLPTPPHTPAHRGSPSQPSLQRSSPSEWLYRRPKNPIASRLGPSTSALSSAIPLSRFAPVQEAPSLLIRTTSVTSTKAGRAKIDVGNDRFDEPENGEDAKISGIAPFWSSMLRPRSRSTRSIPALKTIPSQSQVDLPPSPPPPFPHHSRNDVMEDIPESIVVPRRSPSISSTSSSTISSAASSSHPNTPISAHPDPFGPFATKPQKAHHRRHISVPAPPRDYRLAPLSTSCPNKSILTRSPSISTKDSAITPSNKSVKFVEIPTVHYSNSGAGFWGDMEGADTRSPTDADMGVDVDSMDVDECATSRIGGGAWNANRLGFAGPQWSNSNELDMDVDPPSRVPQEEKNGLKRLMSLSRRSSVTSSASSNRRKSSASTSSTATITPSKPLPSPPYPQLPSTPPKPAISGPYALGSVQAVSPAHSTASLRSTSRHKPKAKSMSHASTPSSGSPGMHDHNLEDYSSTRNAAARSVRSVASIKSDASTSTTKRFRSFLLTKVGVGGAWSKN